MLSQSFVDNDLACSSRDAAPLGVRGILSSMMIIVFLIIILMGVEEERENLVLAMLSVVVLGMSLTMRQPMWFQVNPEPIHRLILVNLGNFAFIVSTFRC